MLNIKNIQVGDILQYKIAKNDYWGKVIDWFTLGGGYSHTAMSVGAGMKAESRAKGVFGTYSIGDASIVDVYRLKGGLNEKQVKQILIKVELYNGCKYDYAGLVGTIRSTLGKLLNAKWLRQKRPYLNDEKKYFCSEIVSKIYEDAIGIDIVPEVSTYTTTPNDVGRSSVLERIS
jgi:uncharacterized protein YycO